MKPETRQHLNDLAKAGFDVSSLERQITSSPLLEAQADRLIGGGILRQDVFTRNSQANAEKVRELESQISQLQTLANNGAGENSPLYQAALEVINEQQRIMIEAGFSEEQVEKIAKDALEAAKTKTPQTQQPPPQQKNNQQPPPANQGAGDMGNQNENYLDIDTYQKQTEAQVFGNASLAAIISRKLNKAEKLGIEVSDKDVAAIGSNLRDAMAQGKQIEQFLDEKLGITAKQKELDEANRQKEIDEAFNRGKSEGMKEGGTPRRVVTKNERHPIYDNIQRRAEEPQQQNTDDNNNSNKQVPRNKWNDPEVFRTRGSKEERVMAFADAHQKTLEQSNTSE